MRATLKDLIKERWLRAREHKSYKVWPASIKEINVKRKIKLWNYLK